MLYSEKKLETTLAIISINSYFYEIQKTLNSAAFLCHDCKKLAILPSDGVLESPVSCDVYKGGQCITSMMNAAIKNSSTEWVLLVFAGSNLQKKLDVKYSRYITSHKDILFPVIDRIWTFDRGSMNGIYINKKFHEEIGDFGEGDNLEITKLMWAGKAIEKGAKFKGIVGVQNL
jgi:hypothetical protein